MREYLEKTFWMKSDQEADFTPDLFFSKLREMICNDHKNLKVFATVLCLYGNTLTVGKALLDDYSELTVPLTYIYLS